MSNATLATLTTADVGSHIVILNAGAREGILAEVRQIPSGFGAGIQGASTPVTMVRFEGYSSELHFHSSDGVKIAGVVASPTAERSFR